MLGNAERPTARIWPASGEVGDGGGEEFAQDRRPFGVLGAARRMAEIAVEFEIAGVTPAAVRSFITPGARVGGNNTSVRHST